MKKLVICMLVLIFLYVKSSFAQFENTDVGARGTGLNGAFTSLSNNSQSLFYNPSGLGQLKYREISLFYSPSVFGIPEISTAALSFAEPFTFGTVGAGIKTFGFNLYRETNFILSYGNNFGEKIFYGLNVNLYNLKIHNYGSAVSFGFDLGAIAYLTSFLRWGFFTKNLNGSTIGISEQKLPQVYKTGFTIQPVKDMNLILEIEKDVKHPLSFKGGFEYYVNQFVDIRAGVGTEPASFSGGISLNYDIVQIEYSIRNFQTLGITNQGSVTLNFGGSNARRLTLEQLRAAFQ